MPGNLSSVCTNPALPLARMPPTALCTSLTQMPPLQLAVTPSIHPLTPLLMRSKPFAMTGSTTIHLQCLCQHNNINKTCKPTNMSCNINKTCKPTNMSSMNHRWMLTSLKSCKPEPGIHSPHPPCQHKTHAFLLEMSTASCQSLPTMATKADSLGQLHGGCN